MTLAQITDELVNQLKSLSFDEKIAYIYNPLEYARKPYQIYLDRFGKPTKQAVLVGMNPGPWGMAQTGVPFGEIKAVRDWMGIVASVEKPPIEHEKRPVLGFDCHRSEVSGKRLWGWAMETYGKPERFFEKFFVANYCPLVFYDKDGKNLTPDKLLKIDRNALFKVCDQALRSTVALLQPEYVFGIGRFAEQRSLEATEGLAVKIANLPHPSPANPAANKGWQALVEKRLEELGFREMER